MKFIYLLGLGALATAESHYVQSPVIEYDRVEIVYLPGNICHVKSSEAKIVKNHRDYVRACMNNKHLRLQIDRNR